VHRWQRCVAAGVALVASLGLSAGLRGPDDAGQRMTLSGAQGAQRFSFPVRAEPVDGLYPGAYRRFPLTLDNPYTVDLVVTDIRISLAETSHPGCLPVAANLEVGPYAGDLPIRVAAEDSRRAGLVPLHMPNSVVDACQEATFTVTLDAVAGPAT
jgi:hypothetical protein